MKRPAKRIDRQTISVKCLACNNAFPVLVKNYEYSKHRTTCSPQCYADLQRKTKAINRHKKKIDIAPVIEQSAVVAEKKVNLYRLVNQKARKFAGCS